MGFRGEIFRAGRLWHLNRKHPPPRWEGTQGLGYAGPRAGTDRGPWLAATLPSPLLNRLSR